MKNAARTIEVCPGTLVKGHSTYSSTCLRRLFDGKAVSHILPYDAPEVNEEDTALFMANRRRISISGVQEKYSLVLEKNHLRLSEDGERGHYLLKPIPRDLMKVDQVPANEHLTMQIARQVYGIPTAENALIFFKNGDPAYITKRFDLREDPIRWRTEDFASLAVRTEQNQGANYKYAGSYQDIADLIVKYIPASKVELERFFSLVVFNYLFSNGDAHFKNFSILETASGDFRLSPAYDLLNTHIHVDDTDFALEEGLFLGSLKHMMPRASYFKSFFEFAQRIGIQQKRFEALIQPFQIRHELIGQLVDHSNLNTPTKRAYLLHYNTKRNKLLP